MWSEEEVRKLYACASRERDRAALLRETSCQVRAGARVVTSVTVGRRIRFADRPRTP